MNAYASKTNFKRNFSAKSSFTLYGSFEQIEILTF